MTTGADVAAAARGWIGTPFLHQGCTRAGCDCVGLARGVAVELGLKPPDLVVSPRVYARLPDGKSLREALARELIAVTRAEMEEGDILLFRQFVAPVHVAILARHPFGGWSLIHSAASFGRVIEHSFSPGPALVGVYRIPGVAP